MAEENPSPDTVSASPTAAQLAARLSAGPGPLLPPGTDHSTLPQARPSPEEGGATPGEPAALGHAGRNLLLGAIAQGGMGAIFKGRDPDLGRELAVKVLREEHRDRPDLVQRFLEEAQVAGQLQHPGVVPIHALGHLDDGRPFFTMKLVRGRTLATLLDRVVAGSGDPATTPADDLPRFLTIFEQVCQTVAYAHSRSVIHRDLKPSNVMVGSFGEVQVMDWGLAKVLTHAEEVVGPKRRQAEESPSAIRTVRSGSTAEESYAGMVIGTPAYMPPEQANGYVERMDERADVFGLGAILCVILTGRPPYSGGDRDELFRRAQQGDLGEAFARLDGCGADAELVGLCKDCLAPERAARPRDAGAVARRLEAYQEGVRERLRQAEMQRAAAQATAVEERKRRRVTATLAAAVVALVLLGGAGAWGLASWRGLTDARLHQALAEAGGLRGRARSASADEPSLAHWAEVHAASRRLDDLLAQGFPSPELRQRVRAWIADLDEEVAAARREADDVARDRKLLDLLADVRTRKGDEHEQTDTDGDYRAAFLAYGVDADALAPVSGVAGSGDPATTRGDPATTRPSVMAGSPDPAITRLRARPPAVVLEVTAALDDWALERRRLKRPAEDWQRLVALARALDDDPWRDALRALDFTNLTKERDKLCELTCSANLARLPPASVQLLGRALRTAGEAGRAVDVLKEAQRLHPGDVWINYELAETLAALRPPRWDEAVRYYTAARAVRPEIGHSLAHALERLGRQDEAAAIFEELTRLRPDNPRHHHCLGVALRELGRYERSEAASRKALELKPDFAEVYNSLGNLCLKQEKLADAEAAYRKALDLRPDLALARSGLGLCLQSQKKLDEAEAEYARALKLDPNLYEALNNRAFLLRLRGRLIQAEADSRKAIEQKPERPAPYLNLGFIRAEQSRFPEAEAAFRNALERKPNDAEALTYLGGALIEQGKAADAEAAFRKALVLNPDLALAHANLGVALWGLRKHDEAEASFRRALELDGRLPLAHTGLGSVLSDRGQQRQAEASHRRALDLKPDFARAHEHLGVCLERQSRLPEAEACYQEAVRLKPRYYQGHANLAGVLYKQNKLSEAEAACRRALALNRNYAPAYSHLGNVLQRRNQLPDAIAAYRRAVELKPDFAEVYNNLGNALVKQEKAAEAEAAYRKAIEVKPDSADAYCNLGHALRNRFKFPEALAAYRRGQELNAKNPRASLPPERTERWVRETERLVALEERLSAFVEGREQPADASERLALARICQRNARLYAAAARFYAESFDAEPRAAAALGSQYRYDAARSAALAAAGRGYDAAVLDDKGRARLRQQAVAWLRADLALWAKRAEADNLNDRAAALRALGNWQTDADLAGLRDQDALDKLPEAERDECRKLWDAVAAALKKAGEKQD
jgi:serine/threonine-protein kinase